MNGRAILLHGELWIEDQKLYPSRRLPSSRARFPPPPLSPIHGSWRNPMSPHAEEGPAAEAWQFTPLIGPMSGDSAAEFSPTSLQPLRVSTSSHRRVLQVEWAPSQPSWLRSTSRSGHRPKFLMCLVAEPPFETNAKHHRFRLRRVMVVLRKDHGEGSAARSDSTNPMLRLSLGGLVTC